MFKRIPGTKDILPEEVHLWQKIEETSRTIFSLYNYQEIRVPILEEVSLFSRSLGETTEIVQKQMFLIPHQNETYAMRPEGTASIVRSYIENNLDKTTGFIKLYYIGPMFRLERPQKGRLRQFHHIGVEAIGSGSAELDVEVISLADTLLKTFLIEGFTIKLNNLGCPADKKNLVDQLRSALKDKTGELCEDCQERYNTNILRILDCKNDSCKETVRKLDIQDAYLCADCKTHFAKVKDGLNNLNIRYEVAPHLVRGLDYYTGTVFEITHQDLGAQDALGAGGRYNALVKELGGPDTASVGFAFGVERLLLLTKLAAETPARKLAYLITLGDTARIEGLKLLNNLRGIGIACDTDYEGKSLKGAMRTANDLKACCVLILGEDELKKNIITLKNMANGEQKEINLTDLIMELKKIC